MSYQKTVGALCAADMKQVGNQYVSQDKLIVVFENSSGGGIAGTLDASYYKGTGSRNGNEREVVCMGNGQVNELNGDMSKAGALDCMHDQKAVIYANNPQPGDPAPSLTTDSRNYMVDKKRKYIVRRLTPTECLRLQGLPDWWCDGANGSDSAIYKMAGNGLAIPCAEDVLRRIAKAYKEEDEHEQK